MYYTTIEGNFGNAIVKENVIISNVFRINICEEYFFYFLYLLLETIQN